MLKDYHKAIISYEIVVKIDPSNHIAYYNIGIMYSNLNDFKNAVPFFSKAINISPNDPISYRERAKAYYHIK